MMYASAVRTSFGTGKRGKKGILHSANRRIIRLDFFLLFFFFLFFFFSFSPFQYACLVVLVVFVLVVCFLNERS